MSKQLENFLNDLILIIQEKYDDSLINPITENPDDKAYRLGLNFAYYDILNLIEEQLTIWDPNKKQINKIAPILGQKCLK